MVGAAFQSSLANEPLLIVMALLAVYIVLGVLYESYVHPITILSTLPSAGVGALLALLHAASSVVSPAPEAKTITPIHIATCIVSAMSARKTAVLEPKYV